MYTDNELLFPHYAIAALKHCRGQELQSLVERILPLDQCHEEKLAFMLMMIRLNGCMACETDSYRAMRGCSTCAMQVVSRIKEDDATLVQEFFQICEELQQSPPEPTLTGKEHQQNRGRDSLSVIE